jgi:hypothetical protein
MDWDALAADKVVASTSGSELSAPAEKSKSAAAKGATSKGQLGRMDAFGRINGTDAVLLMVVSTLLGKGSHKSAHQKYMNMGEWISCIVAVAKAGRSRWSVKSHIFSISAFFFIFPLQ